MEAIGSSNNGEIYRWEERTRTISSALDTWEVIQVWRRVRCHMRRPGSSRVASFKMAIFQKTSRASILSRNTRRIASRT